MNSAEILTKYASEEVCKKIARTVLLSQDIFESSYSDANTRYETTMEAAVREAITDTGIETFWITVIEEWNTTQWNVIQEWALSYKLKKDYIPINIIFRVLEKGTNKKDMVFIEVETDDGKSIKVGEWIERDDGLFALRIPKLPIGYK